MTPATTLAQTLQKVMRRMHSQSVSGTARPTRVVLHNGSVFNGVIKGVFVDAVGFLDVDSNRDRRVPFGDIADLDE